MHIIRCNKCNETTMHESDFAYVFIAFPLKKRKPLRNWDEIEKLRDEADLINAELIERENIKPNEVELHLCPKHTLWFQQMFESEVRQIRRKRLR